MPIHRILYAKPLLALAREQKHSLYKVTKKIGYLSLVTFFTNSVSAVEAGSITSLPPLPHPPGTGHGCLVESMTEPNCAPYVNLATAPTETASRTFDYDPGLVPEIAEVIFALRIKHANIGKPFVVNLSGNYLLVFTKDRIHILDMYTKKNNVYLYQSKNPNITIGLGVSKGLPSNYKSIVIKEDAHGKLYDYAALHSDNITTDDTILSETLSHPFYQITGQDGVENEVKVTKAMAFYRKVLSHERHARCVKESMGILEQIQQILGSGSLVCGPEGEPGILSANHQSVEDMKLDQQLVEATVSEEKYRQTVGYELEISLNFKDQNPLAFLVSSIECKKLVMDRLESRRRKKRTPYLNGCMRWVSRLVTLFASLRFSVRDAPEIINNIEAGLDIPSHLLPDDSDPEILEMQNEFETIVTQHIGEGALGFLEESAGLQSQAIMSDTSDTSDTSNTAASNAAITETDAREAIADASLNVYTLSQENFIPLLNQVRIVNDNLQTSVVSGEYTTEIIHAGSHSLHDSYTIIAPYVKAMKKWIKELEKMIEGANDADKVILQQCYTTAQTILFDLNHVPYDNDLVISVVHYGDVLVGITVGRLQGRVYRFMLALLSPSSVLKGKGAYKGAVAYLRSEVLKMLFSKGMIDNAKAYVLSKNTTKSFLRLGFRDRFSDKDEL